MAEDVDREQTNSEIELEKDAERINDPGGAHAKGYSADTRPEAAVNDQGPIPLAPGPAKHPAVRVPERDNNVHPTGRSEPGDYTPNDRLMGSDR